MGTKYVKNIPIEWIDNQSKYKYAFAETFVVILFLNTNLFSFILKKIEYIVNTK